MLAQNIIEDVVMAVDRMVEGRKIANNHDLGRMAISRRMQAIKIVHILSVLPDLLLNEIKELFGTKYLASTMASLIHAGVVTKTRCKVRCERGKENEVHRIYTSTVRYSLAPDAFKKLDEEMSKPWF